MEVLEEAFNSFLDIINEYASQQDLSEEDKKQLLKLVEDAYVNKRIEYFLNERLTLIPQHYYKIFFLST